MLFVLALAFAFAAYLWYYYCVLAPKWDEKKAKRAACSHDRWTHMNAFGDPRLPVRTCDECGVQEHLETPVPCPHCGGNINANAVKIRVN